MHEHKIIFLTILNGKSIFLATTMYRLWGSCFRARHNSFVVVVVVGSSRRSRRRSRSLRRCSCSFKPSCWSIGGGDNFASKSGETQPDGLLSLRHPHGWRRFESNGRLVNKLSGSRRPKNSWRCPSNFFLMYDLLQIGLYFLSAGYHELVWGDSRSKDVWSNLADVLGGMLREVVLAQKSSTGIDFAEICFQCHSWQVLEMSCQKLYTPIYPGHRCWFCHAALTTSNLGKKTVLVKTSD